MLYGSTQFGTVPYGDLTPGATTTSPNVDVTLGGLGNGGRLNLVFSFPFPNIQGADVNLDDLGSGGVLNLFFNRNPDGTQFKQFADAGELWRRVPMNKSINFRP